MSMTIINNKEIEKFVRYVSTNFVNPGEPYTRKFVDLEYRRQLKRHRGTNKENRAIKATLRNCYSWLSEVRQPLSFIRLAIYSDSQLFFNGIEPID